MRTRVALVLVVAVSVGAGAPAGACTGFAVYADRPLYGMNFDYDTSRAMRLFIDETARGRVFNLGFEWSNGSFARTVGMNDRGLFVSDQELHPMTEGVRSPYTGEMYPWQLYHLALAQHDSVGGVLEALATENMVQGPSVSLHLLFADAAGNAAIVEPGSDDDIITMIDGDYLVMTNFPCGEFVGVDPSEVRGVGADRYVIAHRYLSEHAASFDVENAFTLLEKASFCLTRASLVFDPVELEVYVALERDFDHVLRISLENGAIETHAGYDEPRRWLIGSDGIPTASLTSERRGLLSRLRRLLSPRGH